MESGLPCLEAMTERYTSHFNPSRKIFQRDKESSSAVEGRATQDLIKKAMGNCILSDLMVCCILI